MTDGSSQASAFPFLDAATPAEHRRLRALATVILAGVAGLVASTVAAVAVIVVAVVIAAGRGTDPTQATALLMDGARAGRGLASYIFELSVIGVSSIAAVAAFTAICAWRAGRPLRTFLTTAPRFRWRHAALGLAVFLPVVAAEIWLEGLVKGASAAPIAMPGASAADRLLYAAAALVFLWLAALAEELLFRGWLMQQTHALTRRVVVVIVVNAVLFTLAHGDLSAGGLITRFAMGAGWAWVVLRLGGVEFTSGAHLANNLGIALLAQPVLLTRAADQPIDLVSVALQVGPLVVLALVVEAWARRRAAGPAQGPARRRSRLAI